MPGTATAPSTADSRASRSCGRSAQALVHQADERVAIEVFVQRSFARGGDRSVFLGDHDHQRVALLAEAEGGAMPGAVTEFRIGRRGQRKKCAGSQNAIAVNDRRAIM